MTRYIAADYFHFIVQFFHCRKVIKLVKYKISVDFFVRIAEQVALSVCGTGDFVLNVADGSVHIVKKRRAVLSQLVECAGSYADFNCL